MEETPEVSHLGMTTPMLFVGAGTILVVALSSLKLWKKRPIADKPTGPSLSPFLVHPPTPEIRAEKGNLLPDSVEKSDGIEAKAKKEEHLAQKNIGEEERKANKKEDEETSKQKGKEEAKANKKEEEVEEEETPKPKEKEEAALRSKEKGIEADEAKRPSSSLIRRTSFVVGDKSGEIETPIGKLEKPPVPASLKKSGSFLSKIVSFGRPSGEEGDPKEKHIGEEVDSAAENFIQKFKKQLKLQRMESILRDKEETIDKDK